jgi:very-short-patch-repair endonuclease
MNPADMRYKLLAYYSDPRQQPSGGPDWEKCESKFERAVGQLIHDRRYRVVPQFEPFGPNGKRIDFVIEGTRTRLAIECDGPHHDEPEQIVADLARQRQLERCGWTFWRVPASAFYASPDVALESLWRKLAPMGIDPVGIDKPESSAPADQPPARLAAALRFAAERQQPTRAVQTELLPSGQVDLFSRPQPVITEPSFPIATADADEETVENVIALLREANSSFLGKDMRRVIMAAIPRREKVAIRDVVRRCVEALGVDGAGHANRVSGIIDRMVSERVLVSSMTQVWRKPE